MDPTSKLKDKAHRLGDQLPASALTLTVDGVEARG